MIAFFGSRTTLVSWSGTSLWRPGHWPTYWHARENQERYMVLHARDSDVMSLLFKESLTPQLLPFPCQGAGD